MIDLLKKQFRIPSVVTFNEDRAGFPEMVLTHRTGSRVRLYLYGAHLTSWTPPQGADVFFMSAQSWFQPGRAIRGGIPVAFPQFGDGPLPKHGLARINPWTVIRTALTPAGTVQAVLRLTDTPEIRTLWPHPFHLDLTVELSAQLIVELAVHNTGNRAFQFNTALHTYFHVADIRQTTVTGLLNIAYRDFLRGNIRELETRREITFDREMDRVYPNAPDRLLLRDAGHRRTIAITKQGLPDVVVWNPWIDKAQRMEDFGDDEYQRMVCVETGAMEIPVELAPAAVWQGQTTFAVVT